MAERRDDSSEEEVGGRIGYKPESTTMTVKGGVVFKNSSKTGTAPIVGARFVTATAAPPKPAAPTKVLSVKASKPLTLAAMTAAAPAPAAVAPVVSSTVAEAAPVKKVRFANEEPPAAAAAAKPTGGAGTAGAPIEEEVVAPVVDKSAVLASAAVDTSAPVIPAIIKAAMKAVDVRAIVPPDPIGLPVIGPKQMGSTIAPLQAKLKGEKPVEVVPATTAKLEEGSTILASGPVYTPITSPEFPYFMVQTYRQYSKLLGGLLRMGANGKPIAAAKEIDKEACKKFDPNKVENFYYQKLLRDYLSFGTPYRGSLIYHGLGTGKTCTSIAAGEALYWGGQKKIYIMTPATLSNNYRRELGKCGYFPLRRANFWEFLPTVVEKDAAGKVKMSVPFFFLTETLGLPAALIEKQGGGWVPNPEKPSNWDTLKPEHQESIREQQRVHLAARFRFIHYNGVSPAKLAQLAEAGMRDGTSEFDNAVVIIDEVHNLVRTINGTRISGRSPAQIVESGIEPREASWSMPLRRERPGFIYPRGYTLYRLLQNAVGAKIICLSATPMINYAQELAVLVNIIGGEQRVVEIPLSGLRTALTADEKAAVEAENKAAKDRSVKIAEEQSRALGKPVDPVPPTILRPEITSTVELWAKYHPEIDYYSIEETADRTLVLRITPVPYGFMKVANPDYPMRGFVRMSRSAIPPPTESRERGLDLWGARLVGEMEERGFWTKKGLGAEAVEAVRVARSAGIGTVPATKLFKCLTYPMLPDDGDVFVPNFVDRTTLKIMNRDVLIARCSGLASYFKGGSEELMPRTSKNEIVMVPMSDFMFKEYAAARSAELEMESLSKPEAEAAGATSAAGAKKRKGMTAAEQDLYAQATKTLSAGFKSMTRAACNWVFPEEVPRPKFSKEEQAKALGLDRKEQLIAADLAEDTDVEQAPAASVAAAKVAAAATGGASTAAAAAKAEEGEETPEPAILADEPVPTEEPPMDAGIAGRISGVLAGLEAKADTYLNTQLATFSPKYAAILERIHVSPGPALVYSQFKTLEGLGIFAAALRAAPEKYLPLDIVQQADGSWEIPEDLMEAGRPRYILYTGDQGLDKRRLLLQLYNADVAGLPPKLSAQCAALLAGAPDNRDGRVARVFMITQSGAEGISLFNTRQVHIMEPYWNNVRLQQVIGRAIRTCSHMNLPWEDREVEVYTYLSVFTKEQKEKGARHVMMADAGKTTDESIFEIATNKQKLADGLSAVLQEAAIDCTLHEFENGITGECFKFGKGLRPNFLWHPDWKRDLQMASMVRKA